MVMLDLIASARSLAIGQTDDEHPLEAPWCADATTVTPVPAYVRVRVLRAYYTTRNFAPESRPARIQFDVRIHGVTSAAASGRLR